MARHLFRTALRRPAPLLPGLICLAAGVALVAQPADAHPRSPAASTAGYVALGDSYASGEGLPPFEPGTEGVDGCHRSVHDSYPALLADSRQRGFAPLTSVACSGARTADVVATVPGSTEPPQISSLSRRTRTVTLTIGGNDAGFSPVLADCVYSPVPEVQAGLPGKPGCRDRDDAYVSTQIAALAGAPGAPAGQGVVALPTVLDRISAAAPRATIFVTGYPSIFGRRMTDPAGCRVNQAVPLYVGASDAAWIRTKAADLNAAIRSAARRARTSGADVRYVDVARGFRGHNLCDKKSAWLNGVVLTPTSPPELAPATFHPTARGQVAYATSVLTAARPRWSHHLVPQP